MSEERRSQRAADAGSVRKPPREFPVRIDPAIAEKRPVRAALLHARQVAVDHEDVLLVGGRALDDLPVRRGHEGLSPELDPVLVDDLAVAALDAFVAQAMDYTASGSGLERATKLLQDLHVTHPMPVRRVRLLLDWVREGDYDRIVRGEYVKRGEEPSAREEAGDAGSFYADRIGGAIQAAGSSVAEVGQQLGDWLKRTRGGDGDA